MLSSRASTQTHILRDYALKQFKRDPQFEVAPPTIHSGRNFPQFFPEDLAMPENIQPTIQRFLKHVFTHSTIRNATKFIGPSETG